MAVYECEWASMRMWGTCVFNTEPIPTSSAENAE